MFNRQNNTILFIIIAMLVLFSGRRANAQSSIDYNWYFNANGGATSFFGDVQNKDFSFSNLSDQTDFGFGGRLGKYISPVFAIHLQGTYTNLKGQKQSHDLKFTSNLTEAQLGVTVNFSNLLGGAKARAVSVYGLTGFGGIFFTGDTRQLSTGLPVDESENVISTPGNESQTALIIPVGLGFDFKLAPKWYINLETGLRLINSDKPDGIVSGSHKDTYYYSSLGLSFDFGKKKVKKTEETPAVVEAPKPVDDSQVNLIYHIPERVKSNDDFILECEIIKGSIDGKAELTQVLPIGFEVLDTVIGNTRVEFQNYTLNLHWDQLPEDPVFTVKYKVHVKEVYGTLPLSSILYLEKTGKQYRYKTNIYVANVKNIPVVSKTIDTLPEIKPSAVSEKVIYKVQIRAAYKSEIPLQQLANKYHLRDEIKEDYVGNWYRYSVGSFDTYEAAKQYRKQIIDINGIRDAFVVAYKNGKRIDQLSELKKMSRSEQMKGNTVFDETGRYYRIQVLALKYNKISPDDLENALNIDEEITEEESHNWRKYTVGKFSSLEDAKILKQKMIDKGITDAFVVIYNNGRRITW